MADKEPQADAPAATDAATETKKKTAKPDEEFATPTPPFKDRPSSPTST